MWSKQLTDIEIMNTIDLIKQMLDTEFKVSDALKFHSGNPRVSQSEFDVLANYFSYNPTSSVSEDETSKIDYSWFNQFSNDLS